MSWYRKVAARVVVGQQSFRVAEGDSEIVAARADISVRRKRKRSEWSDQFARSILGQMR